MISGAPENLRFSKGDVVVLPFPFSDLSASKKRPAVVVATLTGDDVICCQSFRYLSEADATTSFPKSVKRVLAELVREKKGKSEQGRLVTVLDYIGNQLDITIKYFDPNCIPAFREELVQKPNERYDQTVLAFEALGGTFTVGQYPGLRPVDLEYSRQLSGPGEFLEAGIRTILAERTFRKVRGIEFLVDSGLHEGKAAGIYKKSSLFRHLQAPHIWVYSQAQGNSGIDRFLESVKVFNMVMSSDKLKALNTNVQNFLKGQLKKKGA